MAGLGGEVNGGAAVSRTTCSAWYRPAAALGDSR
jgi:hypothetical protein